MLLRVDFLANRPVSRVVGSFVLFTSVFSVCGASLLGCLSSTTRSTGASLPQATEKFSSEAVQIEISHNCSGGRCDGLDAIFQNLLNEELQILVTGSKVTRASESLALVYKNKVPQKILVVPPKDKIKATFVTQSPLAKTLMTYVRPTSIWCSLKVDSACSDATAGEAECAAAARSYYRQYVDLKGWIQTSFAVKAKSWQKAEVVSNVAPEFLGNLPSINLSPETEAPYWYGPHSQHTVFYRYSCDAKCACSQIDKPRDFVVDDKFLPVEK